MEHIKRKIEDLILRYENDYPCIYVTGLKGSGKTTALDHLKNGDRGYVSLSDLSDRHLANKNPAEFFQKYYPPLVIDDIHYAPNLLQYICTTFLDTAENGAFWLAGSFETDEIKKILNENSSTIVALHMNPLSQQEIHKNNHLLSQQGESHENNCLLSQQEKNHENNYLPSPQDESYENDYLFSQQEESHENNYLPSQQEESHENKSEINPLIVALAAKCREYATPEEIYNRVFYGNIPAFSSNSINRYIVCHEYIQTYIEQEINRLIDGVDNALFYRFMCEAALQTGQLLNARSIAEKIGVATHTVQRWVKALEQSHMIFLLPTYREKPELKRVIKTPKLYFTDTGIAAYLLGCIYPEDLEEHPLCENLLKNYAISELKKDFHLFHNDNCFWYYRDKDSLEIDFIYKNHGKFHFVNICCSEDISLNLLKPFDKVGKYFEKLHYSVYSLYNEGTDLNGLEVTPFWML